MEPEGSLPHSQVPATCPHPEPARSSPYLHIPLPPLLNTILPSTPGSPHWYLYPGFPTKTLYTPLASPIRATFPAHLILLGFITRTILGEEYRTLSSSLCSFPHSPVTSPLLGPNIHVTRSQCALELGSIRVVWGNVSSSANKIINMLL